MEANVIYRITKGDETALDTLMDYHSQQLFRVAYGILGSKESAEEVVSDVFYDIWQQRKDLLKIENIGAWLRRLAYNKAISRQRHDSMIQYASQPDGFDGERYCPPVAAADEELISREEVQEINDAIESLPPKCRHVFTMAKLEKIPYNEISDLLDISVSTINFHVRTALDHLKKRLSRFRPPD